MKLQKEILKLAADQISQETGIDFSDNLWQLEQFLKEKSVTELITEIRKYQAKYLIHKATKDSPHH